MKILVTGGKGIVGYALVKELMGRGHEVIFCDLAHSNESNYIRCDVGEYRQLLSIFENHKFDYVYHLAAEFGRINGEDFYEKVWKTNAIGTKNIIRLQEKYRFRMIFFSSSEAYGDYSEVMREDVIFNTPIRQLNDYAISKYVNEMQILNSQELFGTESVRLRLFNVYGPGEFYSDYRSVICLFCYRALHNLPYTVYLKHHRCSTYIDDAVRTIANIVDNFKSGEVYNIGSNEYHDIKRLSDIILSYLNKDDSLVTYQDIDFHNTMDKKVDVTKATRDLNHQLTVGLEEGIIRTIEWMKKYYGVQG